VEAERAQAKQFLYDNLYNSPGMEEAHDPRDEVVQGLFTALIADPSQLPPITRRRSPRRAWPAPSPTTSPA
jgi:dGTP triphosphohydrolase